MQVALLPYEAQQVTKVKTTEDRRLAKTGMPKLMMSPKHHGSGPPSRQLASRKGIEGRVVSQREAQTFI